MTRRKSWFVRRPRQTSGRRRKNRGDLVLMAIIVVASILLQLTCGH